MNTSVVGKNAMWFFQVVWVGKIAHWIHWSSETFSEGLFPNKNEAMFSFWALSSFFLEKEKWKPKKKTNFNRTGRKQTKRYWSPRCIALTGSEVSFRLGKRNHVTMAEVLLWLWSLFVCSVSRKCSLLVVTVSCKRKNHTGLQSRRKGNSRIRVNTTWDEKTNLRQPATFSWCFSKGSMATNRKMNAQKKKVKIHFLLPPFGCHPWPNTLASVVEFENSGQWFAIFCVRSSTNHWESIVASIRKWIQWAEVLISSSHRALRLDTKPTCCTGDHVSDYFLSVAPFRIWVSISSI